MEKETKVAPKPKTKKVAPKAKKPTVEMVSYSIEMTIPTSAYANIKPSIVVRGGSIQEAHDFIAPHMNKLWKEYFMINERRPEPTKSPEPTVTQAEALIKTFGGHEIGDKKLVENVPSNVPGPDSSVALLKATQAIESCLSLYALELIESQVIKSVKLSHEDKEALMPLLSKKAIDLTFPEDEKRGN